MGRKRPFPIQPQAPGDDDTLVYKIFTDTAGLNSTYLVIGDTVFLSAEGIQVAASSDGNYDEQNAYTFRDDDGQDVGGLYGRDDAGQNVIAIRAVDPAANGEDVLVEIQALADPTSVSTAAAIVNIQADREGESTDTYISLTKDNNSSEINVITTDRVRISPALNLLGASYELCDVYIKGTFFIIKYADGGTIRYKYLDLSGTGASWTHSTSEP
jgi:hypothetical protein